MAQLRLPPTRLDAGIFSENFLFALKVLIA